MNRKFLLFCVQLGLLFLLYYGWFKPNAWTIPFVGTYYSHFIHYTLKLVMEPSAWFLRVLGYEAEIVDLREIHVASRSFRFIMLNPCLGTDMMFAFAALILAYPGKWINRAWFLPMGYVFIELINIVRVIALSLVWLNYGTGGPIDHHDMFNFVSVVFVLFVFWFWVKLSASAAGRVGNQ